MRPVVTPEEMRKIDAAATVNEAVLIQRAGWAVANTAIQMMDGAYGRRVAVVAGKGNNGNDGRRAAAFLHRRGVRVSISEPGTLPPGKFDLVIDGAYGTGFHGEYHAPKTKAPVLAIDIPSGVDGSTGVACTGAVRADVTVTFVAMKPGLLLNDGPDFAGSIQVADIGLNVENAAIRVVDDSDIALLPTRQRDAHKWESAVVMVAGSPGMMGAATFASQGAQRAGAGMVRLGSPGVGGPDLPVGEAVSLELPKKDWSDLVVEASDRAKAIVVGPGLGRSPETVASVRELLARTHLPVLVDGDALFALSEDEGGIQFLTERSAPTVLTPHEGEFKRLVGSAPSSNRIEDVQRLAKAARSTVLLKGSTTIVADHKGDVLISIAGSNQLATAGTGDVLSGIIGGFLARDIEPVLAAALGAHVHGRAASLGHEQGLVASDLPELVAQYLSGTP